MVQLRDDCFANDGKLMPAASALEILLDRLHPVVETKAAALRAAAGRITAEDVVAARDVPPHDNSAVDGFAVYFDDLSNTAATYLPVTGQAAAGHPLARHQKRGEAVRIFTGAPMPHGEVGGEAAGPDTVLMQEDCTVERSAEGELVIIPVGIGKGLAGQDGVGFMGIGNPALTQEYIIQRRRAESLLGPIGLSHVDLSKGRSS